MSKINCRTNLLKIAVLYAFLIIFVSAICSIPAYAGSTEKVVVSVPAKCSTGVNKWFDTGINIKKGSVLFINSHGTWRLGSGPRECDANGLSNFPPYRGHLYGTLMGKIGKNGAAFPIGKNYKGYANATGRLFLGNNDSNTGDNSGSITVSIKFQKNIAVVSVPAKCSTGVNKWFDTGIDIKKGSVLFMNSNGTWRLGSGPRECDANGLSNFPPYRGYLYGTLMGKIRRNGKAFPIGKNYKGHANASGRLFLGNNDSNTGDNSGSITVSIKIR